MTKRFVLPALAVCVMAGVASVGVANAQGTAAKAAPKLNIAKMSFFITSANPGKGADFGGLEGADAYCSKLAADAGSKRTDWRAYLSTTMIIDRSTTPPKITPGVNARDRIGKGPWYNARGVLVAKNVAALHSGGAKIDLKTGLDEKGNPVKGRGEKPNLHDVLTGSDPQGRYSTAGGDTTCGNWTKSGDGSAIVGHHDRAGLDKSWSMLSWNSSHGTRGCDLPRLASTGGGGLIYCFAAK